MVCCWNGLLCSKALPGADGKAAHQPLMPNNLREAGGCGHWGNWELLVPGAHARYSNHYGSVLTFSKLFQGPSEMEIHFQGGKL